MRSHFLRLWSNGRFVAIPWGASTARRTAFLRTTGCFLLFRLGLPNTVCRCRTFGRLPATRLSAFAPSAPCPTGTSDRAADTFAATRMALRPLSIILSWTPSCLGSEVQAKAAGWRSSKRWRHRWIPRLCRHRSPAAHMGGEVRNGGRCAGRGLRLGWIRRGIPVRFSKAGKFCGCGVKTLGQPTPPRWTSRVDRRPDRHSCDHTGTSVRRFSLRRPRERRSVAVRRAATGVAPTRGASPRWRGRGAPPPAPRGACRGSPRCRGGCAGAACSAGW